MDAFDRSCMGTVSMYVLMIDLSLIRSQARRTVWRFPENERTALAQWYRVQSLADFGGRAKDNGEVVELKAARLYQAADAYSQDAARQAVLSGLKPIRDTDAGLAEKELGTLDDLIGRAHA